MSASRPAPWVPSLTHGPHTLNSANNSCSHPYRNCSYFGCKFGVLFESAKGIPLADLVDWHGFPSSETLRHYLDRELWKLRLRSVTDDF